MEIGDKFSKLTVLEVYKLEDAKGKWRSYCNAQCDCGTHRLKIRVDGVISGHVKSCGCLQKETARNVKLKHGMTKSPTHNSWTAMKQRCNNPLAPGYENYGGRGISYTSRWKSFDNFLEDMGERPENLELDRIDVNKSYSKENCKWSNSTDQSFNKRKRKNTVSKYVGVTFCPDRKTNQWETRLSKENKLLFRKRYATEEEAARAYDKHCLIHYGIVKNFPLENTDHKFDQIEENK